MLSWLSRKKIEFIRSARKALASSSVASSESSGGFLRMSATSTISLSKQPQLSLTTRDVGTLIVLPPPLPSMILFIRISTARYPRLKYSRSIVVMGGEQVIPLYWLLKPVTATSSGTFSPCFFSTDTSVDAMMSLDVTTASVRSPSLFPMRQLWQNSSAVLTISASSRFFAINMEDSPHSILSDSIADRK